MHDSETELTGVEKVIKKRQTDKQRQGHRIKLGYDGLASLTEKPQHPGAVYYVELR